ncbi:roadblock/LC7 domain-containing protein [Acinetobacter towneri]|uniref:roadblock/LC7 domain-containing protein n=1 Tax=Acinetobacter towneri TaxID=202956 RepID=UPI002574DAF8|nr:roadblock/LC7 domain-containing protein [Acinetobacter towneri]MDM1737498.1 roadblock/LC7 domain-containing protein [Acinetobacter towneri]
MLKVENTRQIPPQLIDSGRKLIQEVLNEVSGIDFVMLCSSDGFELALASKKNLTNGGKIAAVSSSILAMVSAFISEIDLTGCKTITLDADNGKVILVGVEHANYPMVIVTAASQNVLIGQLLYALKKVSELLVADNSVPL